MPHDIPSSVFLVILLIRASCRIRTNDPEITNHVLWPTELKRRGGQAIPIAPLQPSALAPFPSWGIQRELVVGDLSVLCLSQISGCKDSDLFLSQQGDVNTISVF